MPRPKKKKYRNFFGKSPFDNLVPKIKLDPEIKKNISIVLILVFGVVSLLSLFDAAGLIGQYINQMFSWLLGYGRWYSPLMLLGIGYLLYAKEKRTVRGGIYLGIVFFVISLQGMFHIFYDQSLWNVIIDQGQGGGYIGMLVASGLVTLMGFWASLILLVGLLVIAVMLILNKTLNDLVGRDSAVAKVLFPFNWLINKLFRRGENDEEGEEEESDEEEEEESDDLSAEDLSEEDAEAMADEGGEDEEDEEGEEEEGEFRRKEVKLEPMEAMKPAPKKKVKVESIWTPTNIEIDFPLNYLSAKVGKSISGDIKANKEIIRQTLETFGIPVEMGEVEIGPTVTRYTMKPADGIKLSKITELDSNLKLALSAKAIRIEAPISGKALVGIEVPNATTAIVGLKEILVSESMEDRKKNMMLALGKDVSGEALCYDLTETPHLLVAGQTKSGKSVGINAMILGLLYQNSPDDLRLIMVDPKRVELPVYNNIPHLLCPVVTDVPKTINALSWLLNEMDRRLDIMMQSHSRNIESYNAKHKNSKMPYIVLVIDELADLMLMARKEVEGKLIRLLQMARAAGIHLILATQRPSADIITGVIKANMPARIAFAVKSGIDSRTILDEMGAEKLLGKGDMLFMATESPKPKRLQGAFVSESEVKKIVSFLIAEAGVGAGYMEGVTDKQKVTGMSGHGTENNNGPDEGGNVDALLNEAIEIVINSGKASTSYLQRRMSIGYGRASRMIDQIEEAGIIGPANGAKPREVLMTKEQYERMIDEGVSGVSIHNRETAEAPESFLPAMTEDEDEDEAEDFEEAEEEILEKIKDKRGKSKDKKVAESADAEAVADDEEEEDNEDEDEEESEDEDAEEDVEEEEETEDEDSQDDSEEEVEGEDEDTESSDEEEENEAEVEEEVVVEKKNKKPVAKQVKASAVKAKKIDDDDFDRLFSR
jgi:S-DNA-T family DNA segregation ATPase FtsK/SpoIIIE